MSVDVSVFKQVMRRFATGVMVLTARDGREMHAITVNAVASVSLDPLLMLVCIEKGARTHELVHAAGAFALNILTDRQRELGERFAYDKEARSHPDALVEGYAGQTGAMVFKESLGFLECRVTAEYSGGDHTIFVGQVVNAHVNQGAAGPLLHYEGEWPLLQEAAATVSRKASRRRRAY
jgi:flavin reductase